MTKVHQRPIPPTKNVNAARAEQELVQNDLGSIAIEDAIEKKAREKKCTVFPP